MRLLHIAHTSYIMLSSWEVKCIIQRKRISDEYRCNQLELELNGRGCISYPNQQEAAQQIIEHYNNRKYLVVLIAQPGAGKTGVVLEVTKQMTTHIDDNQCVDASNVFVLSGMNDIDWNVQFKSKMLRTFQDNVYHRGAINSHIQNRIAEMTNGLCCTDECQIACGSQMKVAHVLASTGLTDLAVARARNMKLLDVLESIFMIIVFSECIHLNLLVKTILQMTVWHGKKNTYWKIATTQPRNQQRNIHLLKHLKIQWFS